MRKPQFILVLISIFVTVISCQKPKECNIEWSKPLNDTTLFISFNVDQNDYKFFQDQLSGVGEGINTRLFYNGKCIFNNKHIYNFPGSDGIQYVQLIIWDTTLVKSEYDYPIRGLANRIKKSYIFTYPRSDGFDFSEPLPSDTGFMNGATFFIKSPDNTFSTRNLLDYYKYNYDTIYNHILKNSYLSVKSVALTCNGFKLITGDFSTLVMNSPKDESSRRTILVDGKFKFVTN
jgi:hypothetical protein